MKRISLSLLGLTLFASASFAQNVAKAGLSGARVTYATSKAAIGRNLIDLNGADDVSINGSGTPTPTETPTPTLIPTPTPTATPTSSCTPPPLGMLNWWPGDHHPNDIQGSNHGTLHGDATYGAGEVAQAFSFDGDGDYVDVGDVEFPATFTIDAWINPASLANFPHILSKDDGISARSYFFNIDAAGTLSASVGNTLNALTQYRTDSPVVSAGSWQHVAVTYDGSAAGGQKMKFYVNGDNAPASVLGTHDNGGTPQKTALSTKIGIFGDGVSNAFPGLIDEVETFSRVLDLTEILGIYNAGSAGKCKPCTSPPPNMLGWWQGEGNPNDLVGGNTLVAGNGNGFGYAAGEAGQAFSFNGFQFATAGTPANLDIASDQVSIDGWVKPNTTNVGGHFYGKALSGAHDYAVLFTNGTLNGAVTTTTGETFVAPGINVPGPLYSLPAGVWTHTALTYDGANIRLYANGVQIGSLPKTGNITTAGAPFNVGGRADGFDFNGQVDEVEVFNRALTASEVQALYAAGASGKCTPTPPPIPQPTPTAPPTPTSTPTPTETPTPTPTPGAEITVFPTTLEFTGNAGGAFPAPQGIQATTSNGASWHGFDTSPWFDAVPTDGPSGTSTTLTPHTEGLVAGTYTQNITFSAAGCSDKVVVVTLVMTGPLITVSPNAIEFTGNAGGAFPAPQGIQITAEDGASWTSFDASPWFDAVPTNGLSGTSTTLTPHTEGLVAGTYTQNITFSAAGCPAKVVVVTLVLTSSGTPTPTPIATPAPTPTPTPASIETPTPTATPTPPATPTPTETPAPTPSATATPTPTPIPTETPTAPPVNISGNISYCSNPVPGPVAGVTLTLTGDATASAISDGSGNYQVSSLAAGGTYTVTPTKAARLPASAGINTVDAIATQRHFLNFGTPLSGCRLTAANVDLNGSVNTVDVIAIQRFFLGRTFGTGSCGQYKFAPASRTYPGLVSDQTGQNYDVLVYGDVASSFADRASGPSQTGAGEGTSVSTLSGLNTSGGEIDAAVAAVALPELAIDSSTSNFIAAVKSSAIDAKNKLVGFQGDLTFDERVVSFPDEPVQKAGITGGNWNVSGNVLPGRGPIRTLRISAYSNDFTPLSGKGTLFELRITRVSKAAQATPLIWAAGPDGFIFIDADLQTQKPGNAAAGVVALRQR